MRARTRHSSFLVASCVAAIACGAAQPSAASAASVPSEQPGSTPTQPSSPSSASSAGVLLSNERTLTTWAHSDGTGPIYVHPNTGAARIARVHLHDADGFPEVYLVLNSYLDAEGEEWVRVRIPGRPNGRTGWLLRELLGGLHRTRWRILVDRSERRMRVYYAGRLLRIFPVGVGKPSTPTPTGHFWVDERFKLSDPSNPYWPYALGTSDYSTLPSWAGEGVVGIHGPFGEPQKIPGDPSHGCIRMLSPDIAWLGPRVTLGTPVDVVP
jgi:L,D-transpeptidase catalytic domain